VSLTNIPIWPRVEPYLFVIRYDKDGGHEDPRVRIEFRGLPSRLMTDAMFAQMPCVECGRPINPLRRREGDTDRLYYAVACQIGVRTACSRSAAAAAEYERFKGMSPTPSVVAQLSLF
jgi:hypothetical protein